MLRMKLNVDVLKIFSLLSLIFYLLAVLFGPSGPNWPQKLDDPTEMVMSNPINQLVYSFIFLLALSSLLPRYKKLLIWINHEKYIVFFLLWCGITIFFAIDPFVSFKRYFQYITTSLVFISFYENFGNEEFLLKIFKYLFSIYVILSLIICLIVPEAKDPSFNTWRGFHATKNNLGQYAGISVIFFSYLYLVSKSLTVKTYSIFFTILSILLLFGSFSMTNIVLITFFIISFVVINSNKIFEPIGISRRFFFIMITLFGFMFISILIINPDLINIFFEITGKDPTFTGRTEIWALVLSQNVNDLITGVGFQSFWIPEKLSKIILFQYWLPNQSHNGYVDIILEVGLIGLLLFSFVVFLFFRRKKIKSSGLWVSIVIYVLILNFSESTLIRPHHFTNVMFYCAYWTVSYKKFNNITER